MYIYQKHCRQTLNIKEKLFCYLIDILKALQHTFKHYRVHGEMFRTIRRLYTNTTNQELKSKTFSDEFKTDMGVKKKTLFVLSSFMKK